MAVKVKLKTIFLAFFVVCFDGAVSEDECKQGDLPDVHRLSVPDIVNHVLTATEMSDYGEPKIKASSENADKYTEILRQETSLQVFLKDIQNFEETTASNKNAPSLRFELIDFAPTCPIKKVDFRITIIDTNNNDPLFTDESGDPKNNFEVKVPMPLPKNIELQNFGEKIYAKDVDLTNTKVTFSIKPEDGRTNDLDIQYGNVVDDLNKVHSAILKSTAALNYQERTYILTVEDEGTTEEGKRTAAGTLIVKRNEEESVITPKFEKSYYTAKFEDDLLEELIVVVQDGTGDLPKIVEEGMKTYFQVSAGRTLAEFYVKSIKKWNKNENAIFTLQINGENLPSPVETVVIVQKDQVTQPELPSFEKPFYTGNVDKNGVLTIDGDIRLQGEGKGEVRFSDPAMETIFSVENKEGLVTIEKIGPIPSGKEEILLTLIVEVDNLEGRTSVLIKIDGSLAPTFDNSFYEGIYDGSKLIVDTITLRNYNRGSLVVKAPNDEFFNVKNDNGVITIETKATLPDKNCIILDLQLEDSTGVLASTFVFLTLSKGSGEGPKFNRCSYKAVYDGVQLYSDFIQVENPDDVEVELSDPTQENLVKVSFTDGRVVLIKQPDLDNYPGKQLFVYIKIKSKQRDITEKEAVLVLTVNKREDNSPYFKNYYQSVEYQPSVSLIATLDVKNGKYGNVKLVDQGYGEYVDAILADTKLVVMKRKDLLDLDVSTLALTFMLTDKKEALVGMSVLVITFDKEEEDEKSTSSTTAATPPPTGDDDADGANTGGLIAGIVVLACLLVLFMLAAIAFWYFKLRNRNPTFGSLVEDRIVEDRIVEVDDNQNFSNRDVKFDDSALSNPSFVDNPKRRNTGYVFNPPPPESDDDASSVEETIPPKPEDDKTDGQVASRDDTDKAQPRLFERRKSVTFDDNVEKIQIEKSQDGDETGKSDPEPVAKVVGDV